MTVDKFVEVSRAIRAGLKQGNNIPATWIETFILVAAAKDKGVRSQEIKDTLGMTQGIVSRMLTLLSLKFNADTKEMEGLDIYDKQLDYEYKHQVRVFLSEEGKALAAKVEALLNK